MADDFLTAELRRKRTTLSKLGKKKMQKNMRAMNQQGYNGFHVVSDCVIMALHCMFYRNSCT